MFRRKKVYSLGGTHRDSAFPSVGPILIARHIVHENDPSICDAGIPEETRWSAVRFAVILVTSMSRVMYIENKVIDTVVREAMRVLRVVNRRRTSPPKRIRAKHTVGR